MRHLRPLALLVAGALLWVLPLIAQVNQDRRAPAASGHSAHAAQAGRSEQAQPGAPEAGKTKGRPAGKAAPGLRAGCQPLGQSDFQTVMRKIELAKQSNDTEQMRRALDDSEKLLGEIVDRMENCEAKPGAAQQQMNNGAGGFAPRSATGGTPGQPSHGGAVKSSPPPENAPGGEGNWPQSGKPSEGRKKP